MTMGSIGSEDLWSEKEREEGGREREVYKLSVCVYDLVCCQPQPGCAYVLTVDLGSSSPVEQSIPGERTVMVCDSWSKMFLPITSSW